jgi:hypothetical protein
MTDMKTIEFDMKQIFSAFIDCYEVLEFISEKEQSDNERDLEMAERVDAKGAALAAAAIKSATKEPSEAVFVLAVAMADIVMNVSNFMFQAKAIKAMGEDE